MALVLLLQGESGQGKSTMAHKLVEIYGYYRVSVDDLYIQYVEKHWPGVYMPDLCKWIAPHYGMLAPNAEHVRDHYDGRDYVSEWEHLLVAKVREAMRQHPSRLVVEGWLLEKYRGDLLTELGGGGRVCFLAVHEYECYQGGKPLTLSDVAALGAEDGGSPCC